MHALNTKRHASPTKCSKNVSVPHFNTAATPNTSIREKFQLLRKKIGIFLGSGRKWDKTVL